ncbi:hypothetical protein B0T20DRAFT_114199 [Sordaria brevicollis]|uniref:DUF7587 domain-containing protein n=1 Tax=Sordaria brevicollis TaxID=83679 RepID=A0AAE0UF10_SORBR|nr:hypothetical protein B0T20DRAFT_114199 [Sordaria brevicollis]
MTIVTPDEFWHIVPSPHDTKRIPNLPLPPKLWHVQHYDSQSINLTHGGFQARNPHLDIRSFDALTIEAGRHFIWDTRNWNSCFLSTFDNKEHADRWAMMTYKRPPYNNILKDPVIVYELDTSKLPPGTTLFQAEALCKVALRKGRYIHHPYQKDEWIFYQQIPVCCIVRRYYPWSDYERCLEDPVDSETLARALVGCEWLPPSSTGGPRPPSPAQTEEDQDGLDELTGRMNGLGLQNGTETVDGVTSDADESAQDDRDQEPTGDASSDHALLEPEEDVETNPVLDTSAFNNPVKHESADSGSQTDDTPKTTDAETQTEDLIDPSPTVDTASTQDVADEDVTDTQLSGDTVVAADPVQEDATVTGDLISNPKDDTSQAVANPTSSDNGTMQAMPHSQQKIIWKVNQEGMEVTKAKFSVVVQVEIRAAD